MKTLSEYTSKTDYRTAEVLWYPKQRCYLARYYENNKRVAEDFFRSQELAEDNCEDWVLADTPQGFDEAEDTENTGDE